MKRHEHEGKRSKNKSVRAALLEREGARNALPSADKARENALLNDLFRSRGNDRLEKVESFVTVKNIRLSDSGLGIGVGALIDSDIRRTASSGLMGGKSATRLGQFADDTRSLVSTPSLSAIPSQRKLRSRRGGILRSRKSETDGSASVKPHIYAGLTHSDLDIQNSRPPLMYQMNVVEWLWLQSANFHRIIIMFLALLFCVVLANVVFALVMFLNYDKDDEHDPYVCDTSACNAMGKRILKTLNKSVSPCDNFYAFVCGSEGLTPGLTQKEDEFWSFGSARGRISYDFHSSISIGNLLKKQNEFPATLILPFYKSCLNEVQRNADGVQPFYALLDHLNLLVVEKTGTYTKNQVISSMASILTYSIKTAAILQDHYYRDVNYTLRMYISQSVPAAYKSGGVISYGYKTFKETIINSFILLSELNVPSADLEIIAHDIICLELFIKDRVKPPPGKNILHSMDNEPDIDNKTCPERNTLPADIPGNFGQPAAGSFDYALLVEELYKAINPRHPNGSKIPIEGDPSLDDHTEKSFVDDLEAVFKQSAPLRLLRYLQWRLFHELSYKLDENAIKTTHNILRHHSTGVPSCVQRLFTFMPFVTPELFMHSFTGSTVLEVEQEFGRLTDLVRTTYYKMVTRNKFKEYEKFIGRTLEPREVQLLREVIAATMRTDDVAPVSFEDRYFRDYPKLYKGIKFKENKFFYNVLTMGQRLQEWRLTDPFQRTFYSIHPRYHVPVWMDKIQARYERSSHRHVIYLPIASAEVPYFRDGLAVSDFGGAAWVFIGAIESAISSCSSREEELFHYLTRPEHRNLLNENYTATEVTAMIRSFKDFLSKYYMGSQYYSEYVSDGFLVDGERWQLRYSASVNSAIKAIFGDQRRYQVLSTMMDDFLERKENWKHRKARLKGLKKYNAKQLFYISLVGRRCDRIGKSKRDHIKVFGPINYMVRANLALSKLDHFAKTFKCPVGSRMNMDPSTKTYFWDRDIDIRNFNYNESELGFLNSE